MVSGTAGFSHKPTYENLWCSSLTDLCGRGKGVPPHSRSSVRADATGLLLLLSPPRECLVDEHGEREDPDPKHDVSRHA